MALSPVPLPADDVIRRVHGLVGEHRELEALALAEEQHEAQPGAAHLAALYGVLLAEQRGLCRKALTLCRDAAQASPNDPTVHVNLVKVCLLSGEKNEATQALRNGLRLCPHDPDLQRMLRLVGVRRPLTFGSLPRAHPLNKYVGLLTWHLGMR